jgi:hypothetical protein
VGVWGRRACRDLPAEGVAKPLQRSGVYVSFNELADAAGEGEKVARSSGGA